MDFNPDDPDTWPADAESWYQVSYTAAVTIANRRVPFPPVNYYAIYGSVFNRDPHHLSLSTLPIQSMSLTFLHPSPNGNSLVRPGITLALGESFGLIIQLSLPFPREVRSTPIVPTLLLSRNYLNTFKRRSLKYLTAIGTALSFIKPSLLLFSTATKQYAGSLPITLIDSFRSVLSHPFSRPSATTKQEFLRYLTTLLVVLPQPLNLHSRLLRAKPHPIATTTSKKTAANGPHILLTLNVGPRLPIANVTSLLCRSPLPLRLKLLLPASGFYGYAADSASSILYLRGSHCFHCGDSHSTTRNCRSLSSPFCFLCSASTT